jgi:hypothetical protein
MEQVHLRYHSWLVVWKRRWSRRGTVSQLWEAKLIAAGLDILDGFILDFPDSTVIVAKPRPGKTAVKQVTLLSDNKSGEVSVLV